MDEFFNYPYRWDQIINKEPEEQIALLEERDRALEQFILEDGRCPLELPYRWAQMLPAITANDEWAISCLEENDRVIEELFARCECGKVDEWFYEAGDTLPSVAASAVAVTSTVTPGASVAGSLLSCYTATVCTGVVTYRLVRVIDSVVLASNTLNFADTSNSISVPAVAANTAVNLEMEFTSDEAEPTVYIVCTWFSGINSIVQDTQVGWYIP